MLHKEDIQCIRNKHNSIVDIKVLLSECEYQRLLRQFPQTGRHWQTSCYTYIVQSELAKYKGNKDKDNAPKVIQDQIDTLMSSLREYTEQYAKFESLINNPQSLCPTENINGVLNDLQFHLEWLGNSAMDQEVKRLLTSQTEAFKNTLEALNAKVTTKDQCRKIFGIQNESPEIPSIGAFVADQMWHITNQGIQNIYQITDGIDPKNQSKYKLWNRIKQVLFFKMHPALKALSDAKANIEVKGRSLHGIRFNNSKSPIPQNMLQSLGPIQDKALDLEKKWTSLTQFIGNLNDLEKIDEIITEIEDFNASDERGVLGQESRQTKQPNSAFQILVFVANLFELGIVLVTRIPLVLLSTALHLFIARPIEAIASIFTKEPFVLFSDALNRMDQFFADCHHKYSLVQQAKNIRNQHYIFKSKWLNDIKLSANSLYCILLNEFSSEKISSYIANGIKSLGRTIITFYNDPRYLMFTAGKKRSEDLVEEYRNNLDDKFFQAFRDTLNSSQATAETNTHKTRNKIDDWKENSIVLPIDFFVEIFVGLPDAVIGPMFRKSPGAATLFFMLSNASLAALFAGAAGGELGSMLSLPPSILSKLFTGKEISKSVTAKLIAVFLQWKIGFFSSEAMASMLKGDYEFLKELFHEPEKITLSISILIAAGWAMQFAPELPNDIPVPFIDKKIPNIYAHFINMFIEESKECAHGQSPANFLEYAFLSLKFGFLCEGFLSGKHKTLITDIISDIKQVFLENRASAEADSNSELNLNHFTPILKKHHITEEHELYLPLLQALQGAAHDNSNQARNIAQRAQETGDGLLETWTCPPGQEEVSSIEDNLEKAKSKLLQALQTAQKMSILGEPFNSTTDARLFFDYLVRTFEDYNACQRERGHFDKQLDNEYLRSFYNKHCYKGSNNFLRLLSIIPLYPITKLSQALQKMMATYLFDAPSTLYKVAKSEAKDAVILGQLVAICGRIGHELVRAYAYSLRAIFCLGALFVAILAALFTLPGLCFKFNPLMSAAWVMNTAIDMAGNISPHRSRGLVSKHVEAAYASQAHIASTNSEDLSLQNSRVMKALSKSNSSESVETLEKKGNVYSVLSDYNQKREKRFFASHRNRLTQLERLSSLDDPCIQNKQNKIKIILDEMEESSLLKKAMVKNAN